MSNFRKYQKQSIENNFRKKYCMIGYKINIKQNINKFGSKRQNSNFPLREKIDLLEFFTICSVCHERLLSNWKLFSDM